MIVANTHDAYLLKDQIESQGLRTGQDYTWRYTPPTNSWLGNHSPTWLGDEVDTPATVEFDFVDHRWATYFQLKWAV